MNVQSGARPELRQEFHVPARVELHFITPDGGRKRSGQQSVPPRNQVELIDRAKLDT